MRILEAVDSYASTKKDTVACVNLKCSDSMLTYGQLSDYSDKLAFWLHENLGGDKTPIVVYGHKNPFMLVCFLACVKSGRAYCPVDISVPAERIRDIIDETKSPVILAIEKLPFEHENVLGIDDIKTMTGNIEIKIDKSKYVKPEDVFYIIFTSGSTGKPKGVQITENCLYNFVNWAVTLGKKDMFCGQQTFLNQAPFSFDLSVMDLYLSLYTGGTLWCLDKAVQTDTKELLASLERSNTDVWVSTPSFANLCLANDCFCSGLLPSVHTFLFCGETLTNSTAALLLERFPDADVINTYGPTESTVAVTDIKVTAEINSKLSPLPVGRPKKGTYIFITNEDGSVLSDGEKGEIVIAGDSVSCGYLNRPDLTEKSFEKIVVGETEYRSYKTGDEGFVKDGLLYYSGRIDLQIKLHGYRIEIEDIESNLLKLQCIKSAVVIPVEKDGAVDGLVSFLVVDFPVESNLKAALKIKKELSGFLPSYMIPKKMIFTDSIPMTNNGKADRKKLKELI